MWVFCTLTWYCLIMSLNIDEKACFCVCVHVNRGGIKETKDEVGLPGCLVYQERQWVSPQIIQNPSFISNGDVLDDPTWYIAVFRCVISTSRLLFHRDNPSKRYLQGLLLLCFMCSTGETWHWREERPARKRCERLFDPTITALRWTIPTGLLWCLL